jgi:hypothetical protein
MTIKEIRIQTRLASFVQRLRAGTTPTAASRAARTARRTALRERLDYMDAARTAAERQRLRG